MIFKNEQERKAYLYKKLGKIYPEFKPGWFYYHQFIANAIDKEKVVLDAGCGRGGFEFGHFAKLVIGVDKDSAALEENQFVDQKIVADLNNIPLPDNYVDVIVATFVFEHLANPLPVWQELARVAKPGGRFIFITSNLLNPVMLSSKILPYKIQNLLIKKLLKRQEEAHRTFHRTNTYHKIHSLAHLTGWKCLKLQRVGNPEYLAICPSLVIPAIMFEKFIDNNFLDFLKTYLVGDFIKK